MNILTAPIKDFRFDTNVSQLFGVNRATYEPNFGIPGHNGIDIVVHDSKQGYGTPILAAADGVVSEVVYDNDAHTRGNGVYIYHKQHGFTTIYWHLSAMRIRKGQSVRQGDIIGEMGNNGFVFPKPTPQNPYAGTHLHFAVRIGTKGDYAGCVDPVPYLWNVEQYGKLSCAWLEDLYYGRSGDAVSNIQTMMKLAGLAKDYEPIAYFGNKTLRDMKQYQKSRGINPLLGYVGIKTRRALFADFTRYKI